MQLANFSVSFASVEQSHQRISSDIKQAGFESVVLCQYPLSES